MNPVAGLDGLWIIGDDDAVNFYRFSGALSIRYGTAGKNERNCTFVK
jgi:hypothetical protein